MRFDIVVRSCFDFKYWWKGCLHFYRTSYLTLFYILIPRFNDTCSMFCWLIISLFVNILPTKYLNNATVLLPSCYLVIFWPTSFSCRFIFRIGSIDLYWHTVLLKDIYSYLPCVRTNLRFRVFVNIYRKCLFGVLVLA